MLIATFGPSTGWAGKTITYENDVFALEGFGPITSHDVLAYDAQGHLLWATEGTRAWVGARSVMSPARPTDEKPEQAAHATVVRRVDQRNSGQRFAALVGLGLVVCGLGAAVYFFLFFDTSVEVPMTSFGNGMTVGGGRVNNFGLMDERRNGILFGFGFAAVGGVLMYIGRMRTSAASAARAASTPGVRCDACGGPVGTGISFCPHCGNRLPWAGPADAPGS
jgi:hypothetical protein